MSTWIHSVRVLGISLAGGLCIAAGAAAQVVFDVDSTLDAIDADTSDGLCRTSTDTCTLRAAVMQANLRLGAIVTIFLPPGTYMLSRPPVGANGPESGDLNLTAPDSGSPTISIVGAGEGSTIIDGNFIDRVLTVHTGRWASMSRLTVRNGRSAGPGQHGGGIRNFGELSLDRCTVSGNATGAGESGGGIISEYYLYLHESTIAGNSSGEQGGGIAILGEARIVRSTIAGNVAVSAGGGISNFGTLVSIASTISGNSSYGDGGGIYNAEPLTLINSTVYGNSADGSGGGIYLQNGIADVNVFNSTIAENGADADADQGGGNGGGVYVSRPGTFHMRNSLMAGNYLRNAPIYDDCSGTVFSYGRNLFWEPGDGCFVDTQSGSAWYLDSLAGLGPLQLNGGPNRTVALLPGSNAIDGGDPELGCIGPDLLPLATDQRGAERWLGSSCDLGAYEAGTLFLDGFESADLSAW